MPFISQHCLDQLVNLVYDNKTILDCLLIYLKANDNTLDIQPHCIAIALEGLRNVVLKGNNDNLKPIKNDAIAKKIVDELKDVFSRYEDNINGDDFKKVSYRILNINHISNIDTLIKSFEVVKYHLKPYEINALKSRNVFLHGRTLAKTDNKTETKSWEYQMYEVSEILKRLFYVLLLKHIGYSGTIINNLKAYENFFGERDGEDILIDLGSE